MSKLSAARIATLKQNGGMHRYIDRPRPGKRMDAKWCISRSGDCFIAYNPENDRWTMWVFGNRDARHSIAGDSSVERINAHWAGFCQTHN